MSLLFIVILFAIAWVVLILPKQRELKRHNALVDSLVVGDEVMSGSGLYGTIVQIDSDTVLLQIAPHVEIKLARRAVAAKVAPVDATSSIDDEDSSEGSRP
ncbi:MAG: preprotein translocase subunit YajC [Acidobacteria bacterium]|nr:preprotein translocase subunit YajC [Acidobacteriota bacterium]